jgi:hypothetical protein
LGHGTANVRASVLQEFGAQLTGEPNEPRLDLCDTGVHLPGVRLAAPVPGVRRQSGHGSAEAA